MKNNQNFNSFDALRSAFGLQENQEPIEASNGDDQAEDTIYDKKMPLRIHLLRIKGNKEATVIKGWQGATGQLEDLQRVLKQLCGVGGSCKNNEIMLQGNHREKVLAWFKEKGFVNVKLAGG